MDVKTIDEYGIGEENRIDVSRYVSTPDAIREISNDKNLVLYDQNHNKMFFDFNRLCIMIKDKFAEKAVPMTITEKLLARRWFDRDLEEALPIQAINALLFNNERIYVNYKGIVTCFNGKEGTIPCVTTFGTMEGYFIPTAFLNKKWYIENK